MSSGEGLEPIALELVDAAIVITFVDGMTDSLLSDQASAKRPSMAAAPRIETCVVSGRRRAVRAY